MAFGCMSSKSTTAKSGKSSSTENSKTYATENGKQKAGATKHSAGMHSAAEYIDAISKRRSIYNLGSKLPHSNKEVTTTIENAIRQCPSSFHVQSSRAVILYGASHKKVWEIVKAALKRVTTEEQYAASEGKVNGCFLAGAGTVLFYEDTTAIKGQQEAYPSYAANFPIWSEHSSAIAQFAVWSALAQDGIGASLQHYNQLIEEDLRAAFDISADWKLIAQMPFGSIEKPAADKTYIPDENRFIVRGE